MTIKMSPLGDGFSIFIVNGVPVKLRTYLSTPLPPLPIPESQFSQRKFMGLSLVNLDDITRRFMLEEIEMDAASGNLYLSPRLSSQGQAVYTALLKEAVEANNDSWLADRIRAGSLLNLTEQRRKPKGGYTTVNVPVTAADTLAEGEFNRFYARGLCRRAIEEGRASVEVYRTKAVSLPRPDSQAKIGTRINVEALLRDLRTHPGVDTALGLPNGPNSGLSVKLS
jgi:hypothetical protein